METTKKYRGGKIVNRTRKNEKVRENKPGVNPLKGWHDFYASVKDYEIFVFYPKRKRASISLFRQGMLKYNLTKEQMREYILTHTELRDFTTYSEYMKQDHFNYLGVAPTRCDLEQIDNNHPAADDPHLSDIFQLE